MLDPELEALISKFESKDPLPAPVHQSVEGLPVKVSLTALDEFKRVLGTEQVPPNHFIRIGVKGGGCSGMSYILGIDEKTEHDEQFTMNEVEFIVDSRQKIYLKGTVINFSAGLDNRGFTFDNPNATSTCGCGSSFSA